jgi:uncharacterized protein YegL
MTYTAEISRTNPSCFLFLVDQSGSMKDGFGGDSTKKKADGVADVINRLLQNLVIKCAKSEGVRDYYYVGVMGYGNDVRPILSGALAGKELVPISEVAEHPARIEERTKKVEDGAGGLVEQKIKFPIWLEPVGDGGTPMCRALATAETILSNWLSQHKGCFPPIVINLTDGESTDGDPTAAANKLRQLSTDDGSVLLFNIHLSSQQSAPIQFPDSENGLPDNYAQLLFRLSSPLPSFMTSIAREEGFAASENSRGFVFNADMISLISFLDIGTRPGNLR